MNRFGKDVVLSTSYKIGGLFSAFLIQIIIARILGIKIFGDWRLAFAWIDIFILVSLAGNAPNIVRLIPRRSKQFMHSFVSSIYKQSEFIFFVICTVFFLLTLLVRAENYQSLSFRFSFGIAFIYGIFNVLNQLLQALLTGNYLNYKVNKVTLIIAPAVKACFIITIYYLFNNNYAVLASVFLTEIVVFLCFSNIYKKITGHMKKTKSRNDGFIFNIPFLVVSLAYLVLSTSDIIMLSFWRSSDIVGGYSAASRISQIVLVFCAGFMPFLPKISKLYHDSEFMLLEKIYLIIIKLISILTFPIVIYFVVYGENLLALYGDGFPFFAKVLIFLSIGQMFEAITGPVGSLLNMTKFEKHNMKLVLAVIFLNIFFNILFIPRFGAIGAAFATMLSIGLINLFKMLIVRKILKIKTFSLKHGWIVMIFIILILANYGLKNIFEINLALSLLVLILNCFIFYLISFSARLIRKNEIVELLKL